ncbi:MAG: methionine adenosyltransferase [Thermodesulfobacteriota bacterium]
MHAKNFSIEISSNTPTRKQPVEIVERKGTGHPDYICDAVMEEISVALSREYVRRFGEVLHHNIDKGLLVAGQVEKAFGRGRVLKPMELIVGDRAASGVGRKKMPVADIARETAKRWFGENLRGVDPGKRHLDVRVVLQPGSAELAGIFERKGKVRVANDTSAAVGYAPFTPTERAVFDTERFLNSTSFKAEFPDTGEDVKVMGFRKGQELDLTVAMPLMARLIKSEKEYFRRKKTVLSALKEFSLGFKFRKVTFNYNNLDRPKRGLDGVYLSLLGTSAEDADSGQVGRGNRVNGVISLNRPMGTEAAAGKNPVSHVGKIYNVLSHRLAAEIHSRVEGTEEVYVWFLSRIGDPIDRPKCVSVEIVPGKGLNRRTVRRQVASIVDESLSEMERFTGELTRGEHPVC